MVDIGTKVVFTGYPSYLQGKEGTITKTSMWMDDVHYRIDIKDGTWFWAEREGFDICG